jgi:hypothetical protein
VCQVPPASTSSLCFEPRYGEEPIELAEQGIHGAEVDPQCRFTEQDLDAPAGLVEQLLPLEPLSNDQFSLLRGAAGERQATGMVSSSRA